MANIKKITVNGTSYDVEDSVARNATEDIKVNYAKKSDMPEIPTKVSQLDNDENYANETYVINKIAEAQLNGNDVDLSGYVTKETGNASQIMFSDGSTFQSKLDAGLLKGEKGDAGKAGPKGDKGDIGPQGPAGEKGDKGEPGNDGAPGPKGDKGDKGDTGAQGPKGDTGATGATPTIKIGTVTTGNAGTNAVVTASTSGTTTTFNFTIPKGNTGATGAKGDKGDKGDTGAQGPQGAKGATGPQGPKGDTGATGAAGATGPKGADGLTTSIKVNGTTYTHSNGLITLPNYPSQTYKMPYFISKTTTTYKDSSNSTGFSIDLGISSNVSLDINNFKVYAKYNNEDLNVTYKGLDSSGSKYSLWGVIDGYDANLSITVSVIILYYGEQTTITEALNKLFTSFFLRTKAISPGNPPSGGDTPPPIALNTINNMTVNKGKTFNILYSTNVSAVKHEISWDNGSTFWDKTSEIIVENSVNYKYAHEAITDVSRYNMAIRVTDRNGNTDTKYFTITFKNNSTGGSENPPAESGNLLDSNGAYTLDDFTGSSVDRNKWDYELGYVRNSELQNYTSTNTEVSNSILALKGIKDSNGNWTSASIISKGHFAFMYGKIECRAKIDPTWGSFSAFWTLGDSFEFGYHDGAAPDTLGEWWAYCGEFDVMEFYSGRLTCGTFFNEREESGRVWYDNYDFNAWHTFAMEWLENGTLIFSIDGHELSRTNPTNNRAFHIPHFILINQAIGASGGTPADSTTAITQYVDWVKYYPASTNNVVLNSSDFYLTAMDFNDNSHNCMVRPTFNDNCINKSLTWESSNPSLVWVHSGLCNTYAGANGTATITATSHSGVSKSITLTVNNGTIR